MNGINHINFNRLQPMEGNISINNVQNQGGDFSEMLADMVKEMNETTAKPQALLEDAMQGKADIHDVMAAIAKSELTVQTATTITGKILQSYEKIMQITI